MKSGRELGRMRTVAAVWALVFAFAGWGYWSDLQAQENAPPPAAAEVAPPPAAAAEGAPLEPAGEGHGGNRSYFWWIIESSGSIGAFLFLLSIYFVALVVRLFMEFRMEVLMPPAVAAACDEKVEKRDFQGVYDVVADDDSFYGRSLATGIAELPNGLAEARDAMEREGEVIMAELEKKISMLAVLGTLGPMIGLLGTLKGMIASFSVIALSDTQLKASEVAGGISEALILTFEGVALSVPAIYFFAVFRNRLSVMSAQVMLKADEFLRHFAHAARKKAPAAQPVAAK